MAIPANNKGKHSIGVLYYLLTRMVLMMRGSVSASQPWDTMVDMFFYREPEEAKEAEEGGEQPAAAEYAADFAAQPLPGAEEGYDAYGCVGGAGVAVGKGCGG